MPLARLQEFLQHNPQVTGGLAQRIEVEEMSPEVGALLLLRRAGLIALGAPLEKGSVADVTLAKEISRGMGGLPLALDQAGAYIEEMQCGLSEYANRYQQRKSMLLKRRGGLVRDHPEPVATTWSLSFERIEQANSAAADLLRLCAFLHPDAIPEVIFSKGAKYLSLPLRTVAADPEALDEAISVLRAYSLIRRDITNHTLSIHSLVQAVLKDEMKKTYRQWAKRTVEVVNQAFPSGEFSTWSDCQRYLAHAQVCALLIEQSKMESAAAAQLFQRVGNYLFGRHQYTEAESFFQKSLAIREKMLGSEHPDVAQSLYYLAALYTTEGEIDRAWPLSERSLAIREKMLGPEHPEVAQSLNNLAMVYTGFDTYTFNSFIESLYQRALAIREKTLGLEHPDVAQSLHNLAAFYAVNERYTKAEQFYQQALAILEKVDPVHPAVAETLHNLASLYTDQEEYDQAEPLYQRALEIREKALGPEHRYLSVILKKLALLYEKQGKYDQAEPLYLRALAIREKAYGQEDPNVAVILHGLADLYRAQFKHEEAKAVLQRALAIYELAFGSDHLRVGTVLNDLAQLYISQEKYEEAEPLLQRSLAIFERKVAPGAIDTYEKRYDLAKLYDNWAKFCVDKGKDEEAEKVYKRALTIYELGLQEKFLNLGWDEPYTNTLQALSQFYWEREKIRELEQLHERALVIREKTSGSEHLYTANSLYWLAFLYDNEGKDEEAKILYKRTLIIYEQQLGPTDPSTTELRGRYVRLLRTTGRKTKTIDLETWFGVP